MPVHLHLIKKLRGWERKFPAPGGELMGKRVLVLSIY